MIGEAQLVESCRNKDRKAQRMLYERFAGKMLAIALRYTHHRFDAEDVIQEAFVKVFLQIHNFRSDCPLDAWIRRIVVNTAISFLRKEKNTQFQTDIDDHTEILSQGEGALADLNYEQLLAVIKTLPTGCRVIFNLFAIEGYSHQEIAKQLDISEGTSKSQYARAKQLLKCKLENVID
jgi:RNA polymerase sigma-70 factor (ECF subfamily)